MKFVRQIRNYRFFTRRYLRFERLFTLSQKLFDKEPDLRPAAINRLALINRWREDIQDKIGELDLVELANCSDCKGACCTSKTENYFTVIDFLMKKASTGRIIAFTAPSGKVFLCFHWRRFKAIVKRLIGGATKRSEAREVKHRCSYLKNNGCELEYRERPIRCVVYACEKLEKELSKIPDKKEEYAFLIEQLYIICLSVFAVQKIEANIPKSNGRLALK